MQAISIRQPWAYAIMRLGKDVENRTWHPPRKVLGTRVLVHAGKQHDPRAAEGLALIAAEHNVDWRLEEIAMLANEPGEGGMPLGCVVGSVVLVDSTRYNRNRSPWFAGPVGWLLRDPRALSEPAPCRGRPGFWAPGQSDFATEGDWLRCVDACEGRAP